MKLLPRSILSFIRNCENPYKIFVVNYNSPSSVWEFLLLHTVTNNRQFVSFSVVWMWKNISLLFAWLIVKFTAFYVFIFQVTFFLRETLFHMHCSYWAVWYFLIDSRKYCLLLDIYPFSVISGINNILPSVTRLESDYRDFSIINFNVM